MLLGLDGQAHYSATQKGRKWIVTDDYVTWDLPNDGRWGGNPCWKRTATLNTFGANNYLLWSPLMNQAGVWVPQSTGVCGFAFKTIALARHQPGNPAAAGENSLISIYEGDAHHCCVCLNTDGTLALWSQGTIPSAHNLHATSPGVIADNQWAYIEIKWDLTAGAEIHVDGLSVLNYSGSLVSGSLVDTYTNVWTSVRLLWFASGLPYLQCWLNDFYLLDQEGTGDDLRDFLGDVRVYLLLPNGPGTSTQWTPNTGANWAAADEVPAADDDTTYLSSATPGDRDSYAYTNLPAGAEPLGFQTCLLARKATAGAASIKPTVRSGGSNADATAQGIAATTEYKYFLQPYDTNPITGDRATEAEINAAEFGAVRA